MKRQAPIGRESAAMGDLRFRAAGRASPRTNTRSTQAERTRSPRVLPATVRRFVPPGSFAPRIAIGVQVTEHSGGEMLQTRLVTELLGAVHGQQHVSRLDRRP